MSVAPLLYDIRKSERKNNSNKNKTNANNSTSHPKPLEVQMFSTLFLVMLWYSKLASNTFSSVKSLDSNKWQVKVPGYGLLSLQMLFSWKHAVRLTPNTTGAFSIFYVAGAWRDARKNEARQGDTLFSCVFVARPVFSRLLLPNACYAA